MNIFIKKIKINWRNYLCWSLYITLFIHIFCILTLASVPPVSRDALIHHLAIPKMYLEHGGIYEIPSMSFSYFPMNIDLLYLLPIYFKNDIAANYIHFIFGLLTAGLLYKYLKNSIGNIYGLLGALFFLTTPLIVKLSTTAYVDLGLVFFSWACIYYFLKWYDSNFNFLHLALSGIFCGLALGTKYNGLILLLIIATAVPLAFSIKTNQSFTSNDYIKRNINSLIGLKWCAVFILIAMIIFSPWMVKNIIWQHNPIYPLYNNIFNPTKVIKDDTSREEDNQPRNAFWIRRHVYQESFLQTITIPIRAFYQGQDDNPKFFDGKLNPGLLLLPVSFLIFFRKKVTITLKPHVSILSLFSLFFISFVYFQTDFRIRYMAPAIPPLIILSIFCIKMMLDTASRQKINYKIISFSLIMILFSLFFAYNIKYIENQFSNILPFDYITQKIDRDAYISRHIIEYPVIQYANKHLPDNSKILCLSIGDRTYYINRNVHLADDFYETTNGDFSENSVLKKLTRNGTTHIIIYKPAYYNLASFLNGEQRKVFENIFKNYTKLLYEKNDVALLEIKNFYSKEL